MPTTTHPFQDQSDQKLYDQVLTHDQECNSPSFKQFSMGGTFTTSFQKKVNEINAMRAELIRRKAMVWINGRTIKGRWHDGYYKFTPENSTYRPSK